MISPETLLTHRSAEGENRLRVAPTTLLSSNHQLADPRKTPRTSIPADA
jgi:hypothetical protein